MAKEDHRYQMCSDQPAQIDCRRSDCWHYDPGGNCSNVSPAITLRADGTAVCWSFDSCENQRDLKPAKDQWQWGLTKPQGSE